MYCSFLHLLCHWPERNKDLEETLGLETTLREDIFTNMVPGLASLKLPLLSKEGRKKKEGDRRKMKRTGRKNAGGLQVLVETEVPLGLGNEPHASSPHRDFR
jgi:hypothetical protein